MFSYSLTFKLVLTSAYFCYSMPFSAYPVNFVVSYHIHSCKSANFSIIFQIAKVYQFLKYLSFESFIFSKYLMKQDSALVESLWNMDNSDVVWVFTEILHNIHTESQSLVFCRHFIAHGLTLQVPHFWLAGSDKLGSEMERVALSGRWDTALCPCLVESLYPLGWGGSHPWRTFRSMDWPTHAIMVTHKSLWGMTIHISLT